MTPRERPIIFNGPMIRAILDGSKTQTRRIVKWPAWMQPHPEVFASDLRDGYGVWYVPEGEWTSKEFRCPYGKPCDRLWVREAWMPDPPIDDTWASTQWAGCREGKIAGVPERFRHPRYCNYAANWLHGEVLWTPSIHMPRWASRITLEIVSVRVERLQDISEADAIAEGVESNVDDGVTYYGPYGKGHCDPRVAYAWLWESINGEGSWIPNPWVWVISFARVGDTKPEES